MDQQRLIAWAKARQHRLAGAAIGMALALFIYEFGLLWALFILGCAAIGYWLGSQADGGADDINRARDEGA